MTLKYLEVPSSISREFTRENENYTIFILKHAFNICNEAFNMQHPEINLDIIQLNKLLIHQPVLIRQDPTIALGPAARRTALVVLIGSSVREK
jgi:hypothetical protein